VADNTVTAVTQVLLVESTLVCVVYVHLLTEDRQSSLGRLTNLLITVLGLKSTYKLLI
jgi:hypothetical protein